MVICLSFSFFFFQVLSDYIGVGGNRIHVSAILLQKSLKIRIQEVKTDFKGWNIACSY